MFYQDKTFELYGEKNCVSCIGVVRQGIAHSKYQGISPLILIHFDLYKY